MPNSNYKYQLHFIQYFIEKLLYMSKKDIDKEDNSTCISLVFAIFGITLSYTC